MLGQREGVCLAPLYSRVLLKVSYTLVHVELASPTKVNSHFHASCVMRFCIICDALVLIGSFHSIQTRLRSYNARRCLTFFLCPDLPVFEDLPFSHNLLSSRFLSSSCRRIKSIPSRIN